MSNYNNDCRRTIILEVARGKYLNVDGHSRACQGTNIRGSANQAENRIHSIFRKPRVESFGAGGPNWGLGGAIDENAKAGKAKIRETWPISRKCFGFSYVLEKHDNFFFFPQ